MKSASALGLLLETLFKYCFTPLSLRDPGVSRGFERPSAGVLALVRNMLPRLTRETFAARPRYSCS